MKAVATVLGLAVAFSEGPVAADVCMVPGGHPTIQAAVDDPACDAIELAAEIFAESVNVPRSLTMSGAGGGGAVIAGLLRVAGAGTAAALVELAVHNGCARGALRVEAGGQVSVSAVEIVRAEGQPCPPSEIFEDGFESGDLSAWDASVQ